jgi:hypothetical protein
MKRRTVLAFLISFVALAAATDRLSAAPAPAAPSKLEALRLAMRKLWEEHITWTRLFIVSALGDLPDKAATTDRLLQNQSDLGNAIKPFYGDAAGDKLAALLKDHILIAADIVTAAKAGDGAKLESAKTRWSSNADEIASFLSAANPANWPASDMKSMMHDHLTLTTSELEARLNKDWKADVAAYEKIHGQILTMADMLSDGIARQFPGKLK